MAAKLFTKSELGEVKKKLKAKYSVIEVSGEQASYMQAHKGTFSVCWPYFEEFEGGKYAVAFKERSISVLYLILFLMVLSSITIIIPLGLAVYYAWIERNRIKLQEELLNWVEKTEF